MLDVASRFHAAAHSHRMREVLSREPPRPPLWALVVMGAVLIGPLVALWLWLAIDPHGTPDPRAMAATCGVLTAIFTPVFALYYRWWRGQQIATTDRSIVLVHDAWALRIPLGSSTLRIGRIHARDATGARRSWWTTDDLARKARRGGMFCVYERARRLVTIVGLEP